MSFSRTIKLPDTLQSVWQIHTSLHPAFSSPPSFIVIECKCYITHVVLKNLTIGIFLFTAPVSTCTALYCRFLFMTVFTASL